MRRRGLLRSELAVIVLAAAALAACGTATAIPGSRPAARNSWPYELLTHCGIDEARIGNRYFEAVHPLSDGQGNPPVGWETPLRRGP